MTRLEAGVDNALKIFNLCKSCNQPAIFPTDTIYGMGAPLSAVEANKEVYRIKQRPLDMKMPIIAGSVEQAMEYCDLNTLNMKMLQLIRNSWPGHFTFIVNSKPHVDELYTKDGKIAIRVTPLEWLSEALLKLGEPICATSVNRTGETELNDMNDIVKHFANDIQLFLEGSTMLNVSSKIYDLSSGSIVKIR